MSFSYDVRIVKVTKTKVQELRYNICERECSSKFKWYKELYLSSD